jgi:ABC-type arginine/histidine transport system permease subunit
MLLIHQFDDRYDFALGETRIRLPLHLLRCTTRSFESARERTHVHGLEQTPWNFGVIAFALQPAAYRRDL